MRPHFVASRKHRTEEAEALAEKQRIGNELQTYVGANITTRVIKAGGSVVIVRHDSCVLPAIEPLIQET